MGLIGLRVATDDHGAGSTGDSLITAAGMPARPDALHQRVLAHPTLLADIAFAVGGPFHLMYPERVADNIRGFHDVFDTAGIGGRVYYAKKANKAACVIRACANGEVGVDVSSVGELTKALGGGVLGTDLMVTGPAKSDELLWLAARHGATIAIDSLHEVDRLTAQALPVSVLLRMCPPASGSRFGLTDAEAGEAARRIDPDGPVMLDGFSFHLTGYEVAPRATLALALIERCRATRALGHRASTISIGGGFGVDYVDAEHWRRFTDRVNRRWFHRDQDIVEFYPYHFPHPGRAMLTEILGTAGLANRLRTEGIRLAVEPGRALLDQAGCTVFPVRDSKSRVAHGCRFELLTVDGTSLSLSEQWFASEYLPDPELWPVAAESDSAVPTVVGAATCLESDMISRRRIPLPRTARAGDLVVYPNTAGYQMDSNESGFHDLPIPPKVVLHDVDTTLRWALDR